MRKSGEKRDGRAAARWGMALALALVASLGISASDGRIPIYQATTITTRGSYYLTRDVGAITIQSDGVTLDLNGFEAYQVNVPSSADHYRIRISNGKVQGAGVTVNNTHSLALTDVAADTVVMTVVSAFSVERVTCASMALSTANNGRIVQCTATSTGISLTNSSGNEILNNSSSGAVDSNSGIHLSNSHRNLISQNTANGNASYGIHLEYSSDCRVKDNIAAANTLGGIRLSNSHGTQVTGNTASNSATWNTHGIELVNSNYNDISHNTCSFNGGSGIRLDSASSGNTITYNAACQNNGGSPNAGIRVESNSNTLDWNTASSNSGYGINVSGSYNVVSHNRLLTNSVDWSISCATNTCVETSSGYPTNIPGPP